jgi:hypothetical protein
MNWLLVATEVVSPSGIEAFGEWVFSLGGLSDMLVALGSSGLLVVIYKVLGFLRFLRSPDFEKTAVGFSGALIDTYSKNPELIKNLAKATSEIPEVKNLLAQAIEAKNNLILELEGRKIDVIAKIKSGLFEGEELTALHEYLAKLEAKLNETTD